MNRKDLYNAFNEVDDDILERSECMKKRRVTAVWIRMGAMAACLCVAVAGVLVWNNGASYNKNSISGEKISNSIEDSAKFDEEYDGVSGSSSGSVSEDEFDERRHLSEEYEKVEYQTSYDWHEGTGIINEFPKEKQSVINDFVEAVNNADDIDLNEDEEREIYHLFFCMNNGTTVHLKLYEGGYVGFQDLTSVCVQVDEVVFDKLISAMER